jgi:hypothetical protein
LSPGDDELSDIPASFDDPIETAASIALLALGDRDGSSGRVQPARAVIERLRSRTSRAPSD